MEDHKMSEMTAEEWEKFEEDSSHLRQMFSVILEGAAVKLCRHKKKRAKQSGSRGKYISAAIIYFEKHSQSEALIRSAADEAFKLQLRVWHLERTLRDNGIIVPE
jgi:hypothetical protein